LQTFWHGIELKLPCLVGTLQGFHEYLEWPPQCKNI
jgi:hypothetical protein